MSKYGASYTCSIHNLDFSHGPSVEDVLPLCPLCGWKERNALATELGEVKRQRDALLKAIEIKQLFERKE